MWFGFSVRALSSSFLVFHSQTIFFFLSFQIDLDVVCVLFFSSCCYSRCCCCFHSGVGEMSEHLDLDSSDDWTKCTCIENMKAVWHDKWTKIASAFFEIGRKMVFFFIPKWPYRYYIWFDSIATFSSYIFCYNKKKLFFLFLFEQLEYNDFLNLNPHALRFRSKYHFWIDETYSMRIVPDIIFVEVCVFLFGNILLRFLWPLESITIYVHFYGSCSFFFSILFAWCSFFPIFLSLLKTVI